MLNYDAFSSYMYLLRRFVACQENMFDIFQLSHMKSKVTLVASSQSTVCTVSAIKNCDVLAVYNFFGGILLVSLNKGGAGREKTS